MSKDEASERMDTLYRWAVEYHKKIKAAVIPIGVNKAPAIPSWSKFQKLPPTTVNFTQWFCENKVMTEPSGIAIICGEVSGNLVRLDFDDSAYYHELKDRLPEGAPIFRSQGGGYGVLLRSTEPVKKLPQGTFKNYPKLEVMGTGSYTVVPPTSGYEWLTQWEIIPVVDVLGWLRENVGYEPSRMPTLAEIAGTGKTVADRDGEFIDMLLGTEEGERHNALVRLAGRLRYCGVSQKFAEALLTKHARDWPSTSKEMGAEEIRSTVESVYKYEDRSPNLERIVESEDYHPMTLGELKTRVEEKSEPIAEGLLHRGDILLIFAGAGIGKSTRTENLSAQIASGNAVFGAFPVVKPYRVMLWELENPIQEVVERFERLKRTYDFGNNLGVDVFPSIDINNPAWQRKLRQGLAHFQPDVLVLEPLGSMHTRDENSSTEMRQTLNPLKEIAAEFNLAVVLCHHKGWETEGIRLNRPRGSTAIMDIVTTAVEITNEGDNLSRLNFTKSRSVSRVPIQDLELEYDPDSHVLSVANPRQLRSIEAVFMISRLRGRGYTLEAIGNEIGATKSVVAKWAKGEQPPSEESFQKLKDFYNGVGH